MAIAAELIEAPDNVVLKTQQELVDEHKKLEDTKAGQEISKELIKAERGLRATIREIAEEHRKAIETEDLKIAEILVERRRELEIRLQGAAKHEADLKANFERLEREKEAELNALMIELEAQERAFEETRARQDLELTKCK